MVSGDRSSSLGCSALSPAPRATTRAERLARLRSRKALLTPRRRG